MKRISLWVALFLILFPVSVYAQLDHGNPFQVDLLGSTTPAAGGVVGNMASAIGGTTSRMGSYKEGLLTLRVTSLSGIPGDTLQVWVQHSPDGGTTWTDLARFANVVGTDSIANSTRIAFWSSQRTPGPFVSSEVVDTERQFENKSIAVGTVNMGPIGPNMRVAYNWNSSTASFTFSVTGFFRQ